MRKNEVVLLAIYWGHVHNIYFRDRSKRSLTFIPAENIAELQVQVAASLKIALR